MERVPEPLLDVIDAIVEDQGQGTASELLKAVQKIAPDIALQPNSLTRRLNPLTGRLEQEKGIVYRYNRNKAKRLLSFTRNPTE